MMSSFVQCTLIRSLAAILFLLLSACGGGGGGSTDTGPSLARIEVTPSLPTLAQGSTLNLVATGINSDNSTTDLTNDVTWQSGNDSLATISSSGEISDTTS